MTDRQARLLALSHIYELGAFVCIGAAVGVLLHGRGEGLWAAVPWAVGAFSWVRMHYLRGEV